MGLYWGTLRALAAPARLTAIGLVVALVLVEQARWSRDRLALPVAAAMLFTFVLVAPAGWRALAAGDVDGDVGGGGGGDVGGGGGRGGRGGGDGRGGGGGRRLARLARLARLGLYGALGAGCVGATGVLLPRALGAGPTFLTDAASLPLATALFWVGGWGLGRDIDRHEGLRAARRRAGELAREAERAQLLALRSQLDPHFLFNTLNAIAEWCREDGEVAERAVLSLSAMLRAILEGVRRSAWPLADELALSARLVELHAVRDPEATRLDLRVEGDVAGVDVPPMLLLALVENALKHGPGKGHRGPLGLRVRAAGGRVELELDNPGEYAGARPGGEGLPTLRRRLALAYGAGASLHVEGRGGRTYARLRLPARPPP